MSEPKATIEACFTLDDVRRCIEILEAVVADRGLLASVPKAERQALMVAAGRASRPASHEAKRLLKAFRRAKRKDDRDSDREARAETGIRAARVAPVFVAPSQQQPEPASGQARVLRTPKSCYVCKADFRELHFFYDAMCPECAAFNYDKRFQTASLSGKVALITGSRLKIGYQAALKMLRAGATVIATTRFPHDSAQRFSRELDFAEWGDRLHVHGLDLRHAPSVEIFCRFVERTYERLDILINNAAQTVRRPPGFYSHLLDFEARPANDLPPEQQRLLANHEACKEALSSAPALSAGGNVLEGGGLALLTGHGAGIGIHHSAELSQVAYAFDEGERGLEVFPEGERDADLQQVDLRTRNTWRLSLGEVKTPELLEVQLINAVAPFILCSKLKPLMLRHPSADKHIVNVSAMEGVFSRGTKTDKHPHTNMAKAALNMMTLTSARDYIEHGIHINAVDTGWVTDEDPAVHAQRKKDELDFQPPLDIVDGAARVCDPFFSGLLTGEHVWGRFLKDYKPSSW